LPGFGYAKVSKKIQEEWHKGLNDFILNRVSIKLFVHLIDSRHFNSKLDSEVREFLKSIKRDDQQILEVFTKSDKLNQKERSRLKKSFPNALLVSNLKKSGINEINLEIFKRVFL
jgi:GTP-binding protein